MITRRAALGAAAAGLAISPASAAPDLVEAARQEGTLVWHSSIDVEVCQQIVAGFKNQYPTMNVQLERSGAERILQRITQEYASNIHTADVVEVSDVAIMVNWKKLGWLDNYVPEDVAKYWPIEERDPEGTYASVRASLDCMAYNTAQVKAADAPKSYADLLAPKWRMRLAKAHPGYSGVILTGTAAMVNALGWPYLEKLARQRVLQVQSATEPPKKVAQGERSVMVDGSEYVVLNLRAAGNPIEPVYASEGTALFSGQAAVMRQAPHPSAARLFTSYLFSAAGQQLIADTANLRSFHPGVKLKPGVVKLSDIKVWRVDPIALTAQADAIKQKYSEVFGV
jgi:iron(III) transport system substrate-binding protein